MGTVNSTAQATVTSRVPGAQGIDVASNPSDSVLIDSEGHEIARVQRRDPHTGAVQAQSPKYQGVTNPGIGGVSDGGIWLSEAGG